MKPIRRKKRGVRIIVFLLALLSVILFVFGGQNVIAHAYTAEEEAAIEKVENYVNDLLQNLDTEELQKYLDSLSQFKGVNVKEKLMSVITGDFALDYASLWESVLTLVWEEGKIMIPAFAVILAVALLCGILNSVKSGFMNTTMTDIINFVGYVAVGTVVLACLIGVLEAGFAAIAGMKRQMEIVFPILLTLMAASGGAVSAGVFRPAVAFMSGAITELFTAIVLPSSVVVIVLAFVGNLSEDVRTERLGDLFKSINKWLVGLSLGLFSLFLTVQGIASAQYDGLSLRAAKYLISGSVPIVGGFLSGGLDLVLAGSSLIKNALGSFSVFLLIGTLLRPLVLILAFQIFLRVCAAATEPVGGKISGFLSRLAKDSGYFLAGLLCVAFLYFLTLLLLVCSTGVIY
jgi:stage III sporulation protein AE